MLILLATYSSTGDIFISALLQGSESDCQNYALEVVIRKAGLHQIMGKELISRSEIHSMQTKSWNVSMKCSMAIFMSHLDECIMFISRISAIPGAACFTPASASNRHSMQKRKFC